jgi:UDP-perosamine 4-acetyltransferase
MSSTHHPGESDKPVVVIGAGGHARVLISLLKLLNRPIVGLLDSDEAKVALPWTIDGIEVTGEIESVTDHRPDEVELVHAIGSIRKPQGRRWMYRLMKDKGYTFATLIHPSATVAVEAELGEGVQLLACAVIQPGVSLEENVLVNTRASVDHDTIVGAHTHLAPGATVCGGCEIGPCTHVGAGATVTSDLEIGEEATIGAGATVIRDVPSGSVVVGTPARSIEKT